MSYYRIEHIYLDCSVTNLVLGIRSNYSCGCLNVLPDVAGGVFDDEMMFNEDDDFEVCTSAHLQLKTPAANGLLNFNRLVCHYFRGLFDLSLSQICKYIISLIFLVSKWKITAWLQFSLSSIDSTCLTFIFCIYLFLFPIFFLIQKLICDVWKAHIK